MLKSKYQMGWLLVMFDLPTDTKAERREVARFRNHLLDLGYLMLQYSVYARCSVTLEKKRAYLNQLKQIAPSTGNVKCLFVTDAQWSKTVTICRNYTPTARQITNEVKLGEQLQFW